MAEKFETGSTAISSSGPPLKKMKQATINFDKPVSRPASERKSERRSFFPGNAQVTLADSSSYCRTALRRLSLALKTFKQDLYDELKIESTSLPPPSSLLFQSALEQNVELEHDKYSNSLLKRCGVLVGERHAVTVSPDGNCLFNAVSVLLSGMFTHENHFLIKDIFRL